MILSVIIANIYFILLGHLPTKGEEEEEVLQEEREEEEDIDNIKAYHCKIITQQDEQEQLLLDLRQQLADAQLEHQTLEEQLAEVYLRHLHRQTAESLTSTTWSRNSAQDLPQHRHETIGPDEPQQLLKRQEVQTEHLEQHHRTAQAEHQTQHQDIQEEQCTQHRGVQVEGPPVHLRALCQNPC